ncbi:MAG: LysR family transcriptional regulator [Gammaproteobacteria bacterium]|nr:LysR family transcriptional regulator [Gammaproteobacteria bacterium]MBT8076461.1 LysR family transcriptional regulator [Gammaproteobacteria bacterium]NNK99868.1 LysR family transcriptional regulator [Xanthomonadales bacterium]
MTRAAEVLNVSQPSVSKVLSNAEQQLGYALFDRIKGKLIPTPEADRLFLQVTQVNESVDRLRQVAENIRSMEKGMVRVAATPAFGYDFLPAAVASYRREHGELMFSVEILRHEELAGALLDSRIDIGLGFDAGNLPGIRGELLCRGRFVVLTPPEFDTGNGGAVQLEDLAGLPFIKLDNQGPLDRLLAAHIESTHVDLKPVAVAGSYGLAKALVSHGVGVAIVDEVTARSCWHANVVMRPLEPALKFRISALHIDNEPMSLVCGEFVAHLKSALQRFLDDPEKTG